MKSSVEILEGAPLAYPAMASLDVSFPDNVPVTFPPHLRPDAVATGAAYAAS